MKRFWVIMMVAMCAVAVAGSAMAGDMKAKGTVLAYEAGQSITVKGAEEETTFALAPDVQITGDVKPGAKVAVTFAMAGENKVASAIVVPVVKAAKKAKNKKG